MIVVAPLHELDDAIARWRPSHIVSLASPGASPVQLPEEFETLRLSFHDIAGPRPDLVMATEADVAALLTFGLAWPAERPLLVHCWAGVSRSPAAAYVIACARNPERDVRDLADGLRRVAPFATPNARVVALADGLLRREGAMIASIARIGRGAEVGLGSGFALT